MHNPVETFLMWLDGLPADLADELCGYISILLPEGWFDIERVIPPTPSQGSPQALQVVLPLVTDAAQSWKWNPYISIGGALALASVVDFVCSTRATAGQREEIDRESSEWVFWSHGVSQEANRGVLLRQRQRDARLRGAWIDAAASWAFLRANALSSESVLAWAKQTFAVPPEIGQRPATVPG